ncbi:MAG: hypothetical protein LBH01_01625 [Verrucomicrobiales bacterium]|jgi:hypothetical protein|nr:hypothetical protein [Verrucomicrobiales bacterium]
MSKFAPAWLILALIISVQLPLMAKDAKIQSPQEMVAELQRLDYPLEKDRDYLSFEYQRLFTKACAEGDEKTLPQLVEIFAGMVDNRKLSNRFNLEELFPALANLWLKVWAEQHGGNYALYRIPQYIASPTMPPDVQKMPVDLQVTWQTFVQLRLTLPQRIAGKERPDVVPYFKDAEPFWRFAVSLLRGDARSGLWSDEADRHVYGFWCGTGAGNYDCCRSYLTLMAKLRDGQAVQALASAFAVSDDGGNFRQSSQGLFLTVSGLATQCDLDWCQLSLGCLIDSGELQTISFGGTGSVSGYFTIDNVALILLTQYGGSEGASQLLYLAKNSPAKRWARYIGALAVFVSPSDPTSRVYRSTVGGPLRFNPLTGSNPANDEVQRKILEWYNSLANVKLPPEAGGVLADRVAELNRPESVGILEKLLRQPSDTVAQNAAKCLRRLGKEVDESQLAQPLRFRLTANGEPLGRQTKVAWKLYDKWGNNRSWQLIADTDGIFQVTRDSLLAWDGEITKAVLLSEGAASADPVYFKIEVPVPSADESAVIPMDIATKPLTLNFVLPRPLAVWLKRKAEMRIGLVAEGEYAYGSDSQLTVGETERLVLPRVAAGKYTLTVSLPGTVDWSGEVTGNEMTVPLRFGSEIRYKLKSAYADKLYYRVKLEPEAGRLSEYRTQFTPYFHGVPVGKYELLIPSSAALRKELGDLLPQGVEFGETRVPFSVTKDSPIEVDLGEIEVK